MPPKPSSQPRSWGTRFDTLQMSPSSPSACEYPNSNSSGSITELGFKKRDEKPPHDASVFVGSLPSNIDQGDLTRMLLEHLSEHTEVKNIKVVRDFKGGVCAFVQCENATTASALIQTLHASEPKPFLGRILRYEPARAFRTLLISYRKPLELRRHGVSDDPFLDHSFHSDQPVELQLPYAMRLSKTKNSRFHSILYDSEAVEAEKRDISPRGDAHFIQPIIFDAEALYGLATYFGRLEHFSIYKTGDRMSLGDSHSDGAQVWKSYPAPHNSIRSENMEKLCWEIKWEHRDDCVNALMTLRRVPHLSVTWAHQPSGNAFDQSYSPRNYPASPCNTSGNSLHYIPSPRATNKPSLVTPVTPRITGRHLPPADTEAHITIGLDTLTLMNPKGTECHHRDNVRSCQGNETWKEETGDTLISGISDDAKQQSQDHTNPEDGFETAKNTNNKWAEIGPSPIGKVASDIKSDWATCVEDDQRREKFPSTNYSNGSLDQSTTCIEPEKESCLPQAPGPNPSLIASRSPKSFPITPSNSTYGSHSQAYKGYDSNERVSRLYDSQPEKETDPTTLFVGGLEMYGHAAWDEEKVRKLFARFGGLESVKVVRPMNSGAAFAFVKFDNAQSPARAISEEHNRIYDGRTIRVKLRDYNPPRTPWKFGQGRGRPQNNNFYNPHRHYEESVTAHLGESPSLISSDQSPTVLNMENSDTKLELKFKSISAEHDGKYPKDLQDSAQPGTESLRPSPVPSMANTSETSLTAYREWYDEPATTPAPSSIGSSISTGAHTMPQSMYPYPLPGYGAPLWANPYPQFAQYPMPYYTPYMGYPLPGPQLTQTFTGPPCQDASRPGAGTHAPWPAMGMFGFVPGATQGLNQSPDQASQQGFNGQPPVAPAGFMQNDQGTLIAVYPSEALDQYMTTGPPSQSAGDNLHQSNAHGWPQVPSYHYPIPTIPPQETGLPPRQMHQNTPNVGQWVTCPPRPMYLPAQPNSHITSTHSQTDFNNNSNMHASPHQRRQGPRRDPQNGYSSGRNTYTRSVGPRNARKTNGFSERTEGGRQSPYRGYRSRTGVGEWGQ